MSREVWGDDDEGFRDNEPVALTKMLLHMPPPFTRGLVVNRPSGGMRHAGRLFQAAMWRDYAMTWTGRRTRSGIDQAWCERIGRLTRAECIRRARANLYLARRLRRALATPASKED
jgi:hypothetical protein